MANLSFAQLEQLWVRNGGAPGWAPFMAAIAREESSGNPTAAYNTTTRLTGQSRTTNPGRIGATGLWQIEWPTYATLAGSLGGKSTRTGLYTPTTNAKVAISLFNTGKGASNWKTDAVYKAWMAAGSPVKPTVPRVLQMAGITSGGATTGGSTGATLTAEIHPFKGRATATPGDKLKKCAIGFPNPLAGIADALRGGKNVLEALSPAAYLLEGPTKASKTSTTICLLSKGQVKALKGAVCIAIGGSVGVVGFLVIASAGFGSSGAAKAAERVLRYVPGVRGIAKRLPRRGGGGESGKRPTWGPPFGEATRRENLAAGYVRARTRRLTAAAKARTRSEATEVLAQSRESVRRQRAYDEGTRDVRGEPKS